MKAAIYLRVSSRDGRQDEANQEPACVELCAARGWTPIVYRERESGAKDRAVWRSVVEAARLGQVRAVVVWSLDRVGRSRVQVAHDLAELLRWRVDVASVKDPWLDQAGPMRDLLVQVMAWMAEGERVRLIERTNAGLARARRAGRRLGRPPSITPAAIDRALELRATTNRGWRWVAGKVAAEGLGKFTHSGLEKAAERRQQNGTGTAAPNPGPHAGLRAIPTPETN